MRLKSFTNKTCSSVAIAAVLLMSLCAVTCSWAARAPANAIDKQAEALGSKPAASSNHCQKHSPSSLVLSVSDAKAACCPHSGLSGQAVLKSVALPDFNSTCHPLSGDPFGSPVQISTDKTFKRDIPPPGYGNPIYILHSTYLI